MTVVAGSTVESVAPCKGLVLPGQKAAVSFNGRCDDKSKRESGESGESSFNEATSFLKGMQTLDWFPHMATLPKAASGGSGERYLLSLVTAESESERATTNNTFAGGVKLWNVVLTKGHGKEGAGGGYTIESLTLNAVLQHESDSAGDSGESNSGSNATPSGGSVACVRWYPFVLQADTNEADLKGMLAVLYGNGDLLVYVLPRHLLFPSNIASPHYTPQRVYWREICRISIPLYAVTSFCWNKQQTIMPSSADLNAPASTVMTTQIILGTREGSIGICDLSLPTQPQMLMLIPAHQSLITSIDWSPLNPLSVVTASTDGTVHLWNLADMYHSITLATSKGPFIGAHWLYTLSKPYDSRTASLDCAYPRGSGGSSASGSGGSGSNNNNNSSSAPFDPARHVLVTDDLHHAKLIHVDEPGKCTLLPTTTPRPVLSIYPNARLQSPLIVTVDPLGTLALVAFRSEKDLKNGHGVSGAGAGGVGVGSGCVVTLGRWTTSSPLVFTLTSSIESAQTQTQTQPESESESQGDRGAVQFTAVAWHLLPIGVFAAVSTQGLLHVQAI